MSAAQDQTDWTVVALSCYSERAVYYQKHNSFFDYPSLYLLKYQHVSWQDSLIEAIFWNIIIDNHVPRSNANDSGLIVKETLLG